MPDNLGQKAKILFNYVAYQSFASHSKLSEVTDAVI